MNCNKCKSPVNTVKMARRYVKKRGLEPRGGTLGYCACGNLIVDKEYYEKKYKF